VAVIQPGPYPYPYPHRTRPGFRVGVGVVFGR
jgi:hypothetical protein